MINLTTASNFLKSIKEYLPYDMMLIDINGVIMAAPNLNDRGKVCTLAVQMINSSQERVCVEQGDVNNKNGFGCGIYQILKVNRRNAGVLVILGEGEKLLSIAGIAKLCIERMWEMELLRHDYYRSSEQHTRQLIFNNELSEDDLEYLIKIDHVKPDIPRIPILYVVHSINDNGDVIKRYDADALKMHIYNSEFYGSMDLLCCTLDNNVIQFKAIDSQKSLKFIAYEKDIQEQIEVLMKPLENTIFSAYVGPVQNMLENYSMAYRMCEWLRVTICETGVYYFKNYLFRYLSNKLSKDEYATIFSAISSEMDEASVSNFCEIMDALITYDYNFSRTAEKLFIHKNTAIYRFDKIRNLLGINPLVNSNEKMYIEVLYNYFKTYFVDSVKKIEE